MEDETAAKLKTEEGVREAFGVLSAELVNLKAAQDAQGRLLQAMDLRIRALTGLIDHHHAVLSKLPRPKGNFNAN